MAGVLTMRTSISAFILAVFAASAGPAVAADLPARMPYKAPVYAIPFSWTGLYIGGHLGGGFATSDWIDTGFPGGTAGLDDGNPKPSGFVGGGQIGYNYQFDRLVLGVEADGDWASLKDTAGGCFQDPTQSCTTKAHWFATLTGRLGFTWDRALFYAKGGAAWGHFKYDNPTPVGFLSTDYSASETRSGWTVGGGIEYAFADHWSARLEYDYLDFGTSTPTFVGNNPADTFIFTENLTNRVHMVTVGVNYLFGWPR